MLAGLFRKGLYSILAVGTLCTVAVSSILVYINFYYFLVPRQEKWFAVPAYFDFSTTVTPTVSRDSGAQGIESSTAHYFAAQLDTASIKARLNPKFHYKVVLHLELTRNGFNKEAGNFMVTLSPSGSEEMVRKPAILPYRSPIIELMHDVLGCGMYVTGLWRQTSQVRIPLTDGFEPSTIAVSSDRKHYNANEKVISERKNVFQINELDPQQLTLFIDQRMHIVDAKLSFQIVLRGLCYWIHLLKLPFFVAFTGFIASIELGFVIVVAYLVVFIFGSWKSKDSTNDAFTKDLGGAMEIKVKHEDLPSIKTESLDEDDQLTAVPESPRFSTGVSESTTVVQSRSASSK